MNFIILSSLTLLIGFYFLWRRKNKIKKVDKLLSASALSIEELDNKEYPLNSVELYGKVKSNKTLTAPLSNIECVFYKVILKMQIEEKEEFTNQSGEKGTRWANKTKTIYEKEEFIPFLLEDETGSITVDLKGSELTPQQSYSSIVKSDILEIPESILESKNHLKDDIQKTKEEIKALDLDTFKIKNFNWIEYTLPVSGSLYVMGSVDNAEKGLTVKKVNKNPFIVSVKSPSMVYDDLDKKIQLLFYLGIVFVITGVFLFFYGIKEWL